MAAVRPVQFTDLYDEEFQENKPTSEETMRKLAQNMNMLRALLPIGMIKAYDINLPGVSIPDSDLFAYCDGSEIVAPNSPLNGAGTQNTPDMTSRHLRGGSSSTTSGNEAGGNATLDLTHTHTIGDSNDPGFTLEDGDQQPVGFATHTHDLAEDLALVNLELKHKKVAFYLKLDV
jgi:hypothetical protein